MSDITKTPKEELECKKKYLYEYSMFWECNEGSKCQILEEDVCDLLNELNKEFEDCEKLLDSKDDFIHKFKRDIEELGISIKLFEDDIATKDKKIEEQQATIEEQNKQIEEWEFSFRTEMAHHRVAEKELQEKIREKQATIEQKDKQLERLYNYFQDYLKDEMSGNAFSEMWDFVKEDESWDDE